MISIQTFAFNPLSENTYVVSDETGEAVIIDPGCYEKDEQNALDDYIASNGLKVRYLLNTHCHFDHVLGNYHVKEKYNVPLLMNPLEEAVLRSVKAYVSNFGFTNYQETLPDQFLQEGDIVKFGNTTWSVLFLPGHSPGHIGFYNAKENAIFSGDVLFEGSIGRTDLPGGDFDTLIASIQKKMFILPDHTTVYPGHGATTTIGEEKISNPYCAL
jgi:glyoxylase-like metal-dependent hydrolase (beta-lactamase superfamily II)